MRVIYEGVNAASGGLQPSQLPMSSINISIHKPFLLYTGVMARPQKPAGSPEGFQTYL